MGQNEKYISDGVIGVNPLDQYPNQNIAGGPQVLVGQVPVGPNSSTPPPPIQQGKSNQNSTQNTLLINEIRDGIVIMNDGSYRSVIMCKSINFDLMSGQEKEAVEYSFQGFLNSLYFPVQIFIRSQKVDLRPYLQKLDEIRSQHQNMLLALLMEDYIAYVENLSYTSNIMDKAFYIVVPYFPTGIDVGAIKNAGRNFISNIVGKKEQHVTINEADLEKAKTELRNRVQATIGGLLQAGVQALPLDTQELIELYYDVYNPDTATRQPLKNFDDLSTPVVVKGDNAPTNMIVGGA